MATIENNYTFNTTLNERGPRGEVGEKGSPGFLAFEILDGDLWVEESTELEFSIVGGFLYAKPL